MPLLDTGLHRVFISLGADGVFAADQHRAAGASCPLLPGEHGEHHRLRRRLHGGDHLGLFTGHGPGRTRRRRGLAASVIAMESAETINPAMSEDALRQRCRFFQIKQHSNFNLYGGIQHDAEQVSGHRSRSRRRPWTRAVPWWLWNPPSSPTVCPIPRTWRPP